nr:unnamed protein product [Callosobruchus analis]
MEQHQILQSKPAHAIGTERSDLIYGADFLSLLMAISSGSDQEQNQSRPIEYAQIFEYKNEGGTRSMKIEKLTEALDERPQLSHLLVNSPSKYLNSFENTTYRHVRPLHASEEDEVPGLKISKTLFLTVLNRERQLDM